MKMFDPLIDEALFLRAKPKTFFGKVTPCAVFPAKMCQVHGIRLESKGMAGFQTYLHVYHGTDEASPRSTGHTLDFRWMPVDADILGCHHVITTKRPMPPRRKRNAFSCW